jgi:hypothetical protein
VLTRLPRARAVLRVRPVRLASVVAVLLAATAVPGAQALISDSSSVTTSVTTSQLAMPSDLAVTYTCTPPATIVLRGASTDTGSGSLTIATPAGTQAGDVLIAQVANRNGAASLTAPAGPSSGATPGTPRTWGPR